MYHRIKARLIENGVRNLKQFGYPTVTTENILTDYSMAFESLLKDNRGIDRKIDMVIDELLKSINENKQ